MSASNGSTSAQVSVFLKTSVNDGWSAEIAAVETAAVETAAVDNMTPSSNMPVSEYLFPVHPAEVKPSRRYIFYFAILASSMTTLSLFACCCVRRRPVSIKRRCPAGIIRRTVCTCC